MSFTLYVPSESIAHLLTLYLPFPFQAALALGYAYLLIWSDSPAARGCIHMSEHQHPLDVCSSWVFASRA